MCAIFSVYRDSAFWIFNYEIIVNRNIELQITVNLIVIYFLWQIYYDSQ
jgi:hypothetical protein